MPERHRIPCCALMQAHAAEQTGVSVLFSVVMSSHHHTIIYDPDDSLSEFMHRLHLLVARSMNCLRGRWENFWDDEQPNAVHLVEFNDVLSKMAYAAVNPVTAQLVEHAEHRPGLNTTDAFLRGSSLTVERPAHFFRKKGKGCMPERLTLGWPAQMGPARAQWQMPSVLGTRRTATLYCRQLPLQAPEH